MINSQFVADFGALPLVFDVFGIKCTRVESRSILEKLILIHRMVTENAKEKSNIDSSGSGR